MVDVLPSGKFPCTLEVGKVCPHKKCEHTRILAKCFKCPHYRRFMADMEAEEEQFFKEVEKMRGST